MTASSDQGDQVSKGEQETCDQSIMSRLVVSRRSSLRKVS